MTDARANWVALQKECQKCGLPEPRFFPSKLGERFECEIPGLWKSFDADPAKAIVPALDFVSGYFCRMEKEGKAAEVAEQPVPQDRAEAIAYSATLAKQVLEESGLGGPADHTLLAQAILGLTVALLEKQ